jgi:hypothetical protein
MVLFKDSGDVDCVTDHRELWERVEDCFDGAGCTYRAVWEEF